jgi:hypothetical protein
MLLEGWIGGLLADWKIRSIGGRIGDDLQSSVFRAVDRDLAVVAGLEAADAVLVLPHLHLPPQLREGQLPDKQLPMRVHVDLRGMASTRHSVESVDLRMLML